MAKKKSVLVFLVFFSLVAALVTSAAVPAPASLAQAEDQAIRLKITNKNDKSISLTLIGPAVYRFKVGSGGSKSGTILPGTYNYTLTGCGITVYGSMNLVRNTHMINPLCGANSGGSRGEGSIIDLSTLLKVVPVTIENDTGGRTLLIMIGPASYVFTFQKGAEKEVTLARGTYRIQFFACGVNLRRTFTADKNVILTLKCV